MEADIYWHFRSSTNAQEEMEGIEGIRIWEHNYSPLCFAHYNAKKAS